MKISNQKRKGAFALSPVSAACALLAVFSTTVAAQQAASSTTVVVTGIRKGIEDAISVKKNSDSIVEAVSAEDIGKLPDATVAESLSRLPGVTVQRSSVTGRAQGVSVRGMSPDFNGGLLNGREMASTSGNRGVEFDQYPAELLSTLVVYKTPDASLMGQGLSSTINQQTVRPLDFPGRTAAVGFRKETVGKADSGPGFGSGDGERFNLSYIDQFADRTVGVALGFARYDSKGGGRPKSGWGGSVDYDIGNNKFAGWDGSGCSAPGAVCVKAPAGIQFDTETVDSKRDGAMAVLQFKPNKNFETTVDIFYSKGDFSVKKRGLEGPVGALSTGSNDPGGLLLPGYTLTADGKAIASGTFSDFRGVIRAHNEDYTDELNAFGWNSKLKAGDWTLTSDLSHSKVTKDAVRFETTLGLPGNVTNANDTISFTGFNGNNTDVTKFTTGLNYADPNVVRLTNPQGWGGTSGQDGYYANPVTTDQIDSLRLSAKRDLSFGPVVAVEFGGNYTDRSKKRVTNEGALLVAGSTQTSDHASATVPNPGTGVAGTSGVPITTWEPSGSLGSVYTLRGWGDADILGKSWGVKERVTTAYTRGDIETNWGGFDVRGNVGLQLVHTKQTSSGNSVDTANCNGTTHSCPTTPYSVGRTYSDVLPSLNLATSLSKDTVMRVGLGVQLARASMEDLKGSAEYSLDSQTGMLKGSGGNPYLKPFKANALDVSFERYFGKEGYVSIAGFYKDLQSYVIKASQTVDLAPYLLPGTPIPTAGTVGTFTQPINGSGGTISGVEVAVNVPFKPFVAALDGFGVMASFSNTDSSVKLPTSGVASTGIGGASIPLPGLSRQVTNMRLYYEKAGLQVGLAVRNRSKYVGSITDYQDNNQLVWVKGETVMDAQVSYEFQSGPLKGLSLLAQGNNLGNAEQVRFNDATGDVTERKKFGTQYLLGMNYKF